MCARRPADRRRGGSLGGPPLAAVTKPGLRSPSLAMVGGETHKPGIDFTEVGRRDVGRRRRTRGRRFGRRQPLLGGPEERQAVALVPAGLLTGTGEAR